MPPDPRYDTRDLVPPDTERKARWFIYASLGAFAAIIGGIVWAQLC